MLVSRERIPPLIVCWPRWQTIITFCIAHLMNSVKRKAEKLTKCVSRVCVCTPRMCDI